MRREMSATPAAHDADHLRLALLLDQMPVGIGIFDTGGTMFHANGHFDRLTCNSLPHVDAFVPPMWRGYAVDDTPLEAEGCPVRLGLAGVPTMPGLEYERRVPGEPPRWLSISAVPLQAGRDPVVTGVILVVQDVHEQRAEDRARLLCEARFRNFIEHSNSAIWIADAATGQFEYASPAAVRLGIGGADAATLAEWDMALEPADRARVGDARSQVLRGVPARLCYHRRTGAGRSVKITETSFAMPDAAGGKPLIGAVLDGNDVGEPAYIITGRGERSEAVRQCVRAGYNTKVFASIEEFGRISDALQPGSVVIEEEGSGEAGRSGILGAIARRMRSVLFVGEPRAAVASAPRVVSLDQLIERLSHVASMAEPDQPADDHRPLTRLDLLSQREQQVLGGLMRGGTNKTIAREMGISHRTVETHRAHIMQRLNARNLPELLRMAMTLRD